MFPARTPDSLADVKGGDESLAIGHSIQAIVPRFNHWYGSTRLGNSHLGDVGTY